MRQQEEIERILKEDKYATNPETRLVKYEIICVDPSKSASNGNDGLRLLTECRIPASFRVEDSSD